jgi:hypothetical protein
LEIRVTNSCWACAAHQGDTIGNPCTLKHFLLLVGVGGHNQIDKRQRAFLWAGTESISRGKCKVAWTTVCRPTCLGGLGILDLRFFGFALRLRWEWLRRTQPECCWMNLPEPRRTLLQCAPSVCPSFWAMADRPGCGQTLGLQLVHFASTRQTCSRQYLGVGGRGHYRTPCRTTADHTTSWALSPRRCYVSISLFGG